MILIKNAKVLSTGIPPSMFTSYQPEVHEETPAPELRMSLNQDEVSSSGILEIMDEVFKELHQEYVGGPLPTDTYVPPYLERQLYEEAVSRILDRARSLKNVKGASSMDYMEVVDALRPYATSIRYEKTPLHKYVYIFLRNLLIFVGSNHRRVHILGENTRVHILGENGNPIFTYEDTSFIRPILLLDASSDLLLGKIQRLMLDIKSLRQAQEIYLNYAGIVTETLTSKYQGKTRVSHKGNRTTLHFYLSDTEKAVITFFQEQMPWTLPDPPTDPQSLRKTCQEEGSPFFIISLSKRDHRYLKTR